MANYGIGFFNNHYVPHYTTIINHVLKVGLFRFNNVSKQVDRYVAIIDHSIKIGRNKVFLVLRVPLDILENGTKGITLSDCEVIGMKIKESWSGELVAQCLDEIFQVVGYPVQIIRDGGSDLKKGLNILQNKYFFVITSDIGHYFANIMKRRFTQLTSYDDFVSFTGSLAAKLSLTELAYLLPPKLRTKGRFMGISRIVEWAMKILEIYNGKKTLEFDENVWKKFKNSFQPLKKLEWAIKQMSKEFTIINSILENIKKQGLSNETLDASLFLLELLGPRSHIKEEMISYLEKTYSDAIFLKIPIVTSSDILESLFGKFKYILRETSFSRLTLLLPCLCGKEVTVNEVVLAMKEIQIKDIKEWQKKETGDSLLTKRINALGNKKFTKESSTKEDKKLDFCPESCVNSAA